MSYKRSGGEFINGIPNQPEKDWFKSENGGASRFFNQFTWTDDDLFLLRFLHATFVDKNRTADFTTTKRIREMLRDGANKEDLLAYFEDRNIPGDEITYDQLAEEVLSNPPEQGYLTISNALQWRLQYSRVINLKNTVEGVHNIDW